MLNVLEMSSKTKKQKELLDWQQMLDEDHC